MMDDVAKRALMEKMVEHLPALRKTLRLSQEELAEIAGVSRSTIAFIENRRHPLTWTMCLSLLMVFSSNEESEKMLRELRMESRDFTEYKRVEKNQE